MSSLRMATMLEVKLILELGQLKISIYTLLFF